MLKDLDRRNFTPEAGVILAYHADRRQRIAAQIEEAVVDANLFKLQQLTPEIRQLFFDAVRGAMKSWARSGRLPFGWGRALRSSLAFGVIGNFSRCTKTGGTM